MAGIAYNYEAASNRNLENKNYQVILTMNDSDDDNVMPSLVLPLPATFSFQLGTSYDTPFAKGFMEKLGNALRTAGVTNLTTQSMTTRIWQGTDNVDFNMTFDLYAEDDPQREIVDKVTQLLYWTIPGRYESTGLLKPPGPSVNISEMLDQSVRTSVSVLGAGAQAASSILPGQGGQLQSAWATAKQAAADFKVPYRNRMSLAIGNFIRMDSVVITNVSQNYESLFDTNGKPIKASIDIAFATAQVPVKQDLPSIFRATPRSRTPGSSFNPDN